MSDLIARKQHGDECYSELYRHEDGTLEVATHTKSGHAIGGEMHWERKTEIVGADKVSQMEKIFGINLPGLK